MMHSTIFDYSGSLRRMGNDPQLFDEMVGFLREDSPRWLAQLHRAMERSDWAAVRHAAHTLRGQVSNFGAQRAIQAAGAIEQAARAGRVSELADAVQELDEAFEELLAAVGDREHTAPRPR